MTYIRGSGRPLRTVLRQGPLSTLLTPFMASGPSSGPERPGKRPIWAIAKALAVVKFFTSKVPPAARYATIWIIFAILLLLVPFIRGPVGAFIFSILFSLLLISSVAVVSARPRIRNITLITIVLALATRWAFLILGGAFLEALSFLIAALTMAWASLLLLVSLFKSEEVTTATIWQAISIYLLIGLVWASIYATVNVVAPGSFQDGVLPNQEMTFSTLIYYSFVTLATLGYGDILPMTQQARGLAIMEVLIGVLYMAILISRLVGAWKPTKRNDK